MSLRVGPLCGTGSRSPSVSSLPPSSQGCKPRGRRSHAGERPWIRNTHGFRKGLQQNDKPVWGSEHRTEPVVPSYCRQNWESALPSAVSAGAAFYEVTPVSFTDVGKMQQ